MVGTFKLQPAYACGSHIFDGSNKSITQRRHNGNQEGDTALHCLPQDSDFCLESVQLLVVGGADIGHRNKWVHYHY